MQKLTAYSMDVAAPGQVLAPTTAHPSGAELATFALALLRARRTGAANTKLNYSTPETGN